VDIVVYREKEEECGMREEVLRRFARSSADPELRRAAAKELERRLKRTGLALPPRTRSRADKWPRGRAVPVLRRDASAVEMMIVRAVARTWGAAQFGCSPDGTVFTADTDGYSLYSGRRNNVTGISSLLDEVADIFNDWKRDGAGGRFYERNCCFWDADDGAIFLEVDVRDDLPEEVWDDFDEEVVEADGDVERAAHAPGKNMWQRLFGWIRD
jgi:hypothetical protein